MTGIRVYTLLTAGQRAELAELAARQDRSVSYLVARAIDNHIDAVKGPFHEKSDTAAKVFTRTTPEAADKVKAAAKRLDQHDWQVVNAAVERYLEQMN